MRQRITDVRCESIIGRYAAKALALLPAAFMMLSALSFAAAEDSAFEIIAAFEALVIENNLELASLQEQLSDLEETCARVFLISDSSASVSGGYSFNPSAADPSNVHGVSGSASVSIPLLPQVSLSLSATTSGSASLSVSLSPLAGLAGDTAIEQQLATLRLNVAYKQVQLRWQSRSNLLQYANAKRHMEEASATFGSRKLEYEDAEQQFRAGFNSSADLRSAADALAGASMSHIGAAQAKAAAEKNLYLLCGMSEIPGQIFGFEITAAEIGYLISGANGAYQEISAAGAVTSPSGQTLQIQKFYLEEQLRRTWGFEPGVSISLSGSLSGIGSQGSQDPMPISGTAAANVSLQFSANALHFDEIKDMRGQLAGLERDLLLNQISLTIDELTAKGAFESAQLSVDMAIRHLETMNEALEQAQVDLERNDISENQYQEISRNQAMAETSYLSSLIGLYGQLGNLLQLYSEAEKKEYQR